MKILVRLPNWLGDMVMSAGAMQQLALLFPGAEVSVIVKKGLHNLLPFFPSVNRQFLFSKEEYIGVKGVWRFGKELKKTGAFDLYVSFPDSFSSALMGFAAGAKERIGYRKEGREILLTKAYTKPRGLHRVDEYVKLLQAYSGKQDGGEVTVKLEHPFSKEDYLVININSEASSRRLTTAKAVEVIDAAKKAGNEKILLIGGPKEKVFVDNVVSQLNERQGIESLAGKTTLAQLVQVLASAKAVLTTDSGPAHLANALGTQTVVLFGAGNENNTAPYNKKAAEVVRLGKLSCEPCTKNTCIQFGVPQCLELLATDGIIQTLSKRTKHGN